MKILINSFLLIFTFSTSLFAQTTLKYEKTIADCANQWIVCPKLADNSYQFGFVYEDEGGLNFTLEGAFTIDVNGVFKRIPDNKVNRKTKLTGSMDSVSLVPNGKYTELKIGVFPSWYNISSNDGKKVFVLYTEGYVANAKGNYGEALIPLNKAYLLNPDYKNVRYQFGIALNAKGLYQEALKVLSEAVKLEPKSYLLHQEISFAQMQLGNVEAAQASAKKGLKLCGLNKPRCTMALRLAVHYFNKIEEKPFNYWVKQARKYVVDGSFEAKQISDMLKESNAW